MKLVPDLRRCVFIPTGEVHTGEAVDGVYVDPEGRHVAAVEGGRLVFGLSRPGHR